MTVIQLADWRPFPSTASVDARSDAERNVADVLVCRSCGGENPEQFEISRLVEDDGELTETQLIAIVVLCEGCASLAAAGSWSALWGRQG
jgi:hypothetical protein